MGLILTTVMLVSVPFGYIGGLLSDVSKSIAICPEYRIAAPGDPCDCIVPIGHP